MNNFINIAFFKSHFSNAVLINVTLQLDWWVHSPPTKFSPSFTLPEDHVCIHLPDLSARLLTKSTIGRPYIFPSIKFSPRAFDHFRMNLRWVTSLCEQKNTAQQLRSPALTCLWWGSLSCCLARLLTPWWLLCSPIRRGIAFLEPMALNSVQRGCWTVIKQTKWMNEPLISKRPSSASRISRGRSPRLPSDHFPSPSHRE